MPELISIALIFILILAVFAILTYYYRKYKHHNDYYSNIQNIYDDKRDNIINYPLWLRNKYGEFIDGNNNVISFTAYPDITHARTDSHQNVSEEYLKNPDVFCANEKNAWKRPCPNYWINPEI